MGSFILLKNAEAKGANIVVVDYVDHILGKLEESETKRERFVTTDLNLVKAVRELEKKGLVQYRMKMQPAQPLGLICHDDDLNTLSDWAEKMVCRLIGAKQTAWNCKGHDGVLPDGTKIEVKSVSWYYRSTNISRLEVNIGISKRTNADLLIVVSKVFNQSDCFTNRRFFVLDREQQKRLMNNVNTHVQMPQTGSKYEILLENECSLFELANLKHGYDYFHRMKGKTPPVEMPKESIQFVVDAWESNKYGLMPFDERYEDSSWYAEFVVAHFLKGKVTEQRCAGYDVESDDGLKVQVKLGNLSNAKNPNDCMVTLNALKQDNEYDILVGFCWDDINHIGSMDMLGTKVIIMDKQTVEILKHPYKKGDRRNGRLYYRIKADGNYSKRHPLTRLKPFMFNIDHLAELGQIGWEAFCNKYLKEACEEALQKYGKGDH